MSRQDVTNSLIVFWIFSKKTNKARDAPQSAAALNIPVRGWCHSACLSHQTCPPVCCTYPLPPPPSDFSASSLQVISCCRGNITGRPAGFTLGSGVLPQAVVSVYVCVYKHTEESGRFWLSEKPSIIFSNKATVLCHPPVFCSQDYQSTMINIQTSNKQDSAMLLLVIHVVAPFVQIDFVITHFGQNNEIFL